MAVFLFLGVVLQSFLATAQDNVSPTNAPWQITGSSAYNAASDQTVFSYKVNSYSNGFVSYLHIGIPSCPEIKCAGNKQFTVDSQSGIRGFKLNQDVRPGRSWIYTISVAGMVETGSVSYSLGGVRVSSGVQNYHQYSQATIVGPKCSKTPKISCSISQPRFHGECIGNTVRVPLSTSTQHYTSLKWSTDYAGCSFSQFDTANPVITFHGPICDTEFRVTLEVWGQNGQYEMCSTLVSATDRTPPTFGGIWGPQDVTVQCDDIPAPLHVVAKDTCDNDVQVTFSEVEEDVDYGEYSIYRTWTAVDDCDNRQTYNQLVVVADREPPTLIGVPDDNVIDCRLDVKPCVVVAHDNCDEVTVEREDEVLEGTCVDSWKVIRTWIAEDSSHNAVTAQQTVTVQDNEKPQLLGIPIDATVQCDQVPANIVPSAVDNCQEDLDISASERIVPGSCTDAYTIYRSFSVGDECGNHLTEVWVIEVEDTTPPTMSEIVNHLGQHSCDQIPVPCVVDATDNCAVYSQSIVPTVQEISVLCSHSYTLVYQYQATDNCGNTDSVDTEILVVDDTPPKFSVQLPEQLRVSCKHGPEVNVHVTDDCGLASVQYSESRGERASVEYSTCDYNYKLYRVWDAEDECGNTAIMTQTVSVVDDTPPVLVGLPPDMTLPCDQQLDFNELSVSGIDNCDCVTAVNHQHFHDIPGTCPQNKIKIYYWSVEDCCGHRVEEYRTITYYDHTPPRLSGVPGSVYSQIEHINEIETAHVSAVDNCADFITVIDDSSKLLGSCPHNYKTVNTWSAEDDCGNTVSMSQTIYCDDATPPTFDNPHYDSAIECPLTGYSLITAMDNSPIYEVDLQETKETVPGRCQDEYSVLRHFVASDPCGNTAIKTYTVYVYDTLPPEWSIVPHQEDLYIVIDTLDAYNANYVDDVSAWDLCAHAVDVEFEETTSQMSCENEYILRRKWTASDNCGNSVTISRTIDVQDQTPPSLINIPVDATVDCTDDYATMYDSPTATDYGYSGELDISVRITVVAGECKNSYTAVKCWTVHDCVGQHDVECQTITVTDTGPPSFVYIPPHTTVPCYEVPEPVDLSTAGNDDCGSVIVTRTDRREVGNCDTDYLIIHTYTVVDECDLTTTYEQSITVVDEDPPYFDYVPNNQALECGSFSRYVKATCVDACDYTLEISVTKKDISGTCDDETINVRTWICADGCGNKATAQQSVTFSDVIPPRFNFIPRDLSLPCKSDVSAIPGPPPIRANDNCDSDVDVTLSEFIKPGAYGFQSSINIRVWIATDNCGNTAEMQQTIIIFDNIAPVVTVPASLELDCTEEYQTPTFSGVTDNCDSNPVVDVDVRTPYSICQYNYIKEYEWCPRDKSGNVGACKTMRITVIDVSPPQWVGILPKPYDKVSYTSSWGPESLSATDYCDSSITVTWDSDGSVDLPCPLEERVVYNYHASDVCGNTISYSQTIMVIDDIEPPLAPQPPSVTIECPAELPSPSVLYSDDPYSYEPLRVSYFQQELVTTCEQEVSVERRWVVTDCAFNVNSWVQTITITDTTKPSLPEMEDKTLECEEDDYVGIEAYDACDDYVEVIFDTETVVTGCNSTVYRNWQATDDCGNVEIEVQTIHVYDDEKPQLYGIPTDVTVDNHNVPGNYILQCSDNCGADMFPAEFNEETINGSCDHEWKLVRKWTCTDVCGRISTSVQQVHVVDNESPEISYCPTDITVQLGLVPIAPTLTAVDGQVYGEVVVVPDETEETRYAGEVMKVIERSWTATDECANTALCLQTITVIDTVPPIIPDVPRDTYIDCDDYIITNWDAAYQAITTLLQQSIASVEMVEITPNVAPYPFSKVPGTCSGEYTLTRTWTATDHAGNSLSDTQILSVVDDQPPVFQWDCEHPPSIHEECEHNPPCNPTVTDNCEEHVYANIHEKRIKGTCVNEYTLIRLWDSKDSCGNMVSTKQTVYVGDSNPPNLNLPALQDETFSCSMYNELPDPHSATCNDECSGNLDPKFHTTKHVGHCADSWVIIRTWSCSDVCGHEVHNSRTITTTDEENPQFDYTSDMEDTTIPCEQEPPVIIVTATDNCAEYVQVHSELIGYTVGYTSSTFLQEWVAYDNCGNQANKSREIRVEDLIDPVISPRPPSSVIPCDQFSMYEMPEPHCEDNCGSATIRRSVDTEPGTCDSEYELIVKWVCHDPHNNEALHSMTITVVDNEKPIIDVKSFDIEAPCYDVPPAPSGTASDNCDDVTIEFSENQDYPEYVQGSVADPIDFSSFWDRMVDGTWTPGVRSGLDWSTNGMGQIVPDYFSISPMTIQSYKIARGSDSDLNHCAYNCMADDLCYGSQLWSNSGQSPFRCYLYTKEAMCEVQNEAYKMPGSQSDVTYRTSSGNWLIKPSAVETCTVIPPEKHLCDRYDLVRTWSADDVCGNHVEVVQSIRVWDLTPPTWDIIPNDVTSECWDNEYNAKPAPQVTLARYNGNSYPTSVMAGHGIRPPQASDDCTSKLTVTEDVTYVNEVCGNDVFTAVWVVEDSCGNAATASMILSKLDRTPPTLGYVSPDEDVECVTPLVVPETPNCDDDCNGASVTHTTSTHAGTCDYQLIYHWTCSDTCGNSATSQQRLNIADTAPPTFQDIPSDATGDCLDNIYENQTEVSCVDVCGGCSVAKSVETSVIDCASNQLNVYRYIASDECGNRAEIYQSITYLDTTDPELSGVPYDISVPCEATYIDVPVTCVDDCGSCEIKFSQIIVDYDCESSGKYHVVYRTWTGTDLCGHVTVESQTVTVTDDSFPTIYKPEDRTIECDDQIPVFNANADDDCGVVTLSDSSTTLDGTCEDEYQIIKTWIAVDLCGNKKYASTTLFVVDTQTPTISGLPLDVKVSCDQVPDVPNVVFHDECSYPTPHFEETSNRDGYGCNSYNMTRSWEAYDDCGNSKSGSYNIEVVDDKDPVLTCNGADKCDDVRVECEIYPPLPTVVAHDNCYEHLEVKYDASPTTGSCDHDHSEYREWSTVDGCGAQAIVWQQVIYFDNTPPVLEGHVPDATVECPNDVIVPSVTSNDNCDYALSVVYDDDKQPGSCLGVWVEYRTWTAEDLCGNTDWIAQTVTVVDTTPPSLDVYATHSKVECDRLSDAWHGDVTASDDCDYNMIVKFTEEKFDGSCLDSFTLVRRWSTSDCSGNTASHVQTVYVQDTLPPYFLGTVPQDVTVSQDDVYSGGVSIDRITLEAADNCADPLVSFVEEDVPIDYECDYLYYIIRTWSVVDDCGNSDSVTQTIDMVQTVAPEIYQPDDITVECDSVPPPCDVSIVGDSYQATLTFFERRVDGSCENEYNLIRTWIATDCAYNSGSVVQTVRVLDSSPPSFTREVEDVTGECDCDDIFTVPVIDVVDNCGLGSNVLEFYTTDKHASVVSGYKADEGSCDDEYFLDREWTITDDCGNTAVMDQVVAVIDSTPPQFCDCPANYDQDFECDEVPVFEPPSVTDNCDDSLPPLEESHSEFVSTGGVCAPQGYYAYSWTSTDDCGNSDECTSTINVDDTKPPHVVNGDQFCYPLNGYGPTSNEWAVYNLNEIITVDDTCGGDPTLVFLNCSSVHPNSECVKFTFGSLEELYVHMEVSIPLEEFTGRYYTVWFLATDNCGNGVEVKRVIWVPATPYSYEDAVNRRQCPFGIGTDVFKPNKPVMG